MKEFVDIFFSFILVRHEKTKAGCHPLLIKLLLKEELQRYTVLLLGQVESHLIIAISRECHEV